MTCFIANFTSLLCFIIIIIIITTILWLSALCIRRLISIVLFYVIYSCSPVLTSLKILPIGFLMFLLAPLIADLVLNLCIYRMTMALSLGVTTTYLLLHYVHHWMLYLLVVYVVKITITYFPIHSLPSQLQASM